MSRFAPALALALALPTGHAAAAHYALVVGVSTYNEMSALPSLKHAEDGAVEVGDALADQDYEVTYLTGKDATRGQIEAALAALIGPADGSAGGKARDRDVVVVYLAGHGLRLDRDPKTYFCPRDADPGRPASLVAVDDLQERLRRSRASGGRVLLVDACRDRFPGSGPLPAAALGKADGVCTLYACQDGKKAFEDQKTLRRPVFTHHLLDALHGAILKSDGTTGLRQPVQAAQLARYVKERFAERKSNQTPDDLTGAGGDGAVLVPAARPRRFLFEQTERAAQDTQRSWSRYLEKEVDEAILLNPGVPFDNEVVLDAILVPPGRYLMGSLSDAKVDGKAPPDDETGHPVTLTQPFYFGKFEVTQQQFRTFLENNNLTHQFHFTTDGPGKRFLKDAAGAMIDDTSDFPADRISYSNARAFCDWVTQAALGRWKRKLVGNRWQGYDWECRLPTEAEWEYACRAGTTSAYHFGPFPDIPNANCYFARRRETEALTLVLSPARPMRRGVYAPNAFGLRDMHGNVAEWCSDWYAPYPSATAETDPDGPERSPRRSRVLRGGHFGSAATQCRSAARSYHDPAAPAQSSHGFRVVIAPVERQ